MELLFSNQLEILADQWRKNLFQDSDPFAKRVTLVHGPAMKDWLIRRMLETSEGAVCLGLEWIYYWQFLPALFSLTSSSEEKCHFPSAQDWAWAIEAELPSFSCGMEDRERQDLSFLNEEKKRIRFAKTLGRAFYEYGLYGSEKWEEMHHWQRELWTRIRRRFTHWKIPYEEIRSMPRSALQKISLHIFALPFLDPLEREMLQKISTLLPVTLYFFSPCAHFWIDIRSDRESVHLQRHYQSLGASSKILEDAEGLLWDRNPLLANLGRVGRMMALAFENASQHSWRRYAFPEDLADAYASFRWEEVALQPVSQPSTLLQRVQTDLLLMRTAGDESIPPEAAPSIQFHTAPSRMREVEIAYQQIAALLHRNRNLEPVDVVLMAPDIMDYQPYLAAIFGAAESQLPYQVIDLKTPLANPLLQGFSLLLSLAGSRWDRYDLFRLWEHPPFMEKHRLDADTVNKMWRWMEYAGVVWGIDAKHRCEILRRNHCETIAEGEGGTWREGIRQLLLGLARLDPIDLVDPVPLLDAHWLGLCEEWITTLQRDLSPLADGSRKTLGDWHALFLRLLQTYFFPEGSDSMEEEWKECLHFFSFLSSQNEHLFSFDSLEEVLLEKLQNPSMHFRDTQGQAVRCCSLMPMRTIPSQVVYLLGMEEESFPRKNPLVSSLHLFPPGKEQGRPTPSDWDRYLFLEALVSCRQNFFVSWRRSEEDGGKALAPSPVVQELQRYLQKGYRYDEEPVLSLCTFAHPADPFDPLYFSESSPLRNPSPEDFRLCQALQTSSSKTIPSFFTAHAHQKEPEGRILDLSQFVRLAKHPIRYYFQEVLGITLYGKKERRLEEPLLMNSLDRTSLRSAALSLPLSLLHEIARRKGMLSTGTFKDLSWQRLEREAITMQEYLWKNEIGPPKNSLIFQIGLPGPKRGEGGDWLLPAPALLDRKGNRVSIVGRIRQMAAQGRVVVGRRDAAKLCQLWPEWLLQGIASQQHPELVAGSLIFPMQESRIEAFTGDSGAALQRFFSYWEHAQRSPSPLLPQWVEAFVGTEEAALAQVIEEQLKSPFSYEKEDPYICSAFSEGVLLSQISCWKRDAEEVYGPLIDFCKGKKG